MDNEHLIQPVELDERRDSTNLRIVDCRFDLADTAAGRRAYDEEHIPGAAFLDLNLDLASSPTVMSGRHPLPEVHSIAAKLGHLGIDQEMDVVVYDAANGAMAARAWWILRWLGHDKVRLLDGGIDRWRALQLPASSTAEVFERRFFEPKVRSELVVTTEEIEAADLDSGEMLVIDARDSGRFAGEIEPIDRVAGHIPGAKNLPFPESLNPDGTWRQRAELQRLWQRYLGTDREAPWVAMCGSGVTACHLAISALEAGYREPRLYVGSWSEWIVDPERPIGVGQG